MRISDWSSDVFSKGRPDRMKNYSEGSARSAKILWIKHGEATFNHPCNGNVIRYAAVMTSFGSLRCRYSFETLRNHIPFAARSEEHTSELQSIIRISYAVFCV